MSRKPQRTPLLIEFVGGPGAGKSTLCNQIAQILREQNHVVVRDQFFLSYGTVYRYTAALFFACKAWKFNFFWLVSVMATGWDTQASLLSKFRSWKTSVKQVFATLFVLHMADADIVLCDEGIFSRVVSCRPNSIRDHSLARISTLYPRDSIFVFVSTAPEIVYARLMDRRSKKYANDTVSMSLLQNGEQHVVEYYKKVNARFDSLYELLKFLEKQGRIRKVIRVGGETDHRETTHAILAQIP